MPRISIASHLRLIDSKHSAARNFNQHHGTFLRRNGSSGPGAFGLGLFYRLICMPNNHAVSHTDHQTA